MGGLGWEEKPNSIQVGDGPLGLNFLPGAQVSTARPGGAGGGGGTGADFSGKGDIRASDQPWQGWSHCLKSVRESPGDWGTLRALPLGAEGQGLCLGLGAEERHGAALRRSSWLLTT